MKNPTKPVSLLACTLAASLQLAGCVSTPTQTLPPPPTTSRGEIVVYRESAFVAGGVSLSVGVDERRFANLGNHELARAWLAPGAHEILVQARSAEPTRVKIQLDAGQTLCLRTSASPSTYAKVVMPISLITTGYHFYLNEQPCPADLGSYQAIPVVYQ